MGVFFINWITQLQGPKWNLLLRSVIFTVYLLLGAVIFQQLETHEAVREKKDFRTRKAIFQQMYGINETVFEAFIEEVRRAVDDGYFDVQFDRWSFFGSVFFTATVLTTIGFGHIAPRTFAGRLFCIFYAFFGIPITGLMLKSFGERLVSSLDRFVIFMGERIRKRRSKKNGNDDAISNATVVMFTTLILFLIMLLMLFLLAGISMDYEGWTFFEGCYFGFITLSTIGFGDFVPTTPRNGFSGASHAHVILFIILTAVYITLGLSVVSSVLVSLSRLFESKTDFEFKQGPSQAYDKIDYHNHDDDEENHNEKDLLLR